MTSMTFPRKREMKWVPTDKIVANDNNPRDSSEFSAEQLSLLRSSISSNGVWNPVILTPYKGDTYKLIEGERRWTSAKLEGVKEIPAQIVPRMDSPQQLATMFQMHSTAKGWKIAEELIVIEKLIAESSGMSDQELAKGLAMPTQRFKEQRRLIEQLGPKDRAAIARGDLGTTAALKALENADTLRRARPQLVEQLGGVPRIRRGLLDTAQAPRRSGEKGITHELDQLRRDARDVENVPDDVLVEYITRPTVTLREARGSSETLKSRREVDDLISRITTMNTDLRMFRTNLERAPNLSTLQKALSSLIKTATGLEQEISQARHAGAA